MIIADKEFDGIYPELVITPALPLLDKSGHVNGEPDNIVKRTLCRCLLCQSVLPGTQNAESASTWLLAASPIFRPIS
jgi:hypothetical protein